MFSFGALPSVYSTGVPDNFIGGLVGSSWDGFWVSPNGVDWRYTQIYIAPNAMQNGYFIAATPYTSQPQRIMAFADDDDGTPCVIGSASIGDVAWDVVASADAGGAVCSYVVYDSLKNGVFFNVSRTYTSTETGWVQTTKLREYSSISDSAEITLPLQSDVGWESGVGTIYNYNEVMLYYDSTIGEYVLCMGKGNDSTTLRFFVMTRPGGAWLFTERVATPLDTQYYLWLQTRGGWLYFNGWDPIPSYVPSVQRHYMPQGSSADAFATEGGFTGITVTAKDGVGMTISNVEYSASCTATGSQYVGEVRYSSSLGKVVSLSPNRGVLVASNPTATTFTVNAAPNVYSVADCIISAGQTYYPIPDTTIMYDHTALPAPTWRRVAASMQFVNFSLPGEYALAVFQLYAEFGGIDQFAGLSQYVNSGKYYWEYTVGMPWNMSTLSIITGVAQLGTRKLGGDALGWFRDHVHVGGGGKVHAGVHEGYGSSSLVEGDVIGVALDMDAGSIEYFLNGVSEGVMYSNVTGPVRPIIGINSAGAGNPGVTGAVSVSVEFKHSETVYPAPVGFGEMCKVI